MPWLNQRETSFAQWDGRVFYSPNVDTYHKKKDALYCKRVATIPEYTCWEPGFEVEMLPKYTVQGYGGKFHQSKLGQRKVIILMSGNKALVELSYDAEILGN